MFFLWRHHERKFRWAFGGRNLSEQFIFGLKNAFFRICHRPVLILMFVLVNQCSYSYSCNNQVLVHIRGTCTCARKSGTRPSHAFKSNLNITSRYAHLRKCRSWPKCLRFQSMTPGVNKCPNLVFIKLKHRGLKKIATISQTVRRIFLNGSYCILVKFHLSLFVLV